MPQSDPTPARRPGWVLWVAIAILIIGGAWLVRTVRVRGAALKTPPYPPPQVSDTLYSNRIHELGAITTAPDSTKLTGFRVELANVRVAAIAGQSRAFWIADPQGRQIIVVPTNPNVPMDAAKPGRTVSLVGTVERSGPEPQLAQNWDLDPVTASKMAADPVFIRAESIRPGETPPRNEGQGL